MSQSPSATPAVSRVWPGRTEVSKTRTRGQPRCWAVSMKVRRVSAWRMSCFFLPVIWTELERQAISIPAEAKAAKSHLGQLTVLNANFIGFFWLELSDCRRRRGTRVGKGRGEVKGKGLGGNPKHEYRNPKQI